MSDARGSALGDDDPSPSSGTRWCLYVVRTRLGTLYTGIATDVVRRLAEHERGAPRGAKYLRAKGPLVLAYAVDIGERSLALRSERALKQLPRAGKERLLADRPDRETLLARLRVGP